MAKKAISIMMDETLILDLKQVAGVFNISVADLIKNAVKEYLSELKSDPFYRLTANVQDSSDEEASEILTEIDGSTDDDLSIAFTKRINL
ncbi:MAG: hypothetical protein IKZ63_00310 [Oscillospiraceae bacterium]|nr:hypothetical protein [Oscillospiraceae bacterium]